MAIKVLFADDHLLIHAGIQKILKQDKDIELVGTAESGLEALKLVKEKLPDVVILDIQMPVMDGIEATKKIKEFQNEIKVLAYSIHSGKRFIRQMLDKGASGYILKDSSPVELLKAIHSLAAGNMYLSPEITSIALDKDSEIASEERTTDFILKTKLHRPLITNDCILRADIINNLENNIYKPLTLVSAPAGYGKSVTISQWLDHSKALSAWISLDEEHNNPRTFLWYLHTAIENILPGSLKKTELLIKANELPAMKIVAFSLINELDQIQEDFILVLDDYHNIDSIFIHSIIDEILNFPPEHMHLAILTRKDPPLKLEPLLVNDRMNDIRMKELSFSDLEISDLLKTLHNIEAEESILKTLQHKTDGWILGLRLATINIEKKKDNKWISEQFKLDAHSLREYLVKEVLSKQPEEFKDILIITSICDRFSPELIDEIIARKTESGVKKTNGNVFVKWLIKSNLFVISLDYEGQWFRYHHFFQSILKQILKTVLSEEQIKKFHRYVSIWFEKQGFIEEAIHHMLLSDDINKSSLIIVRHRWERLNDDKWYIVQKWLDMLPEELRKNNADLLLSKAWSAYENFQLEKIPSLLDQIQVLLNNGDNKKELLGEWHLFNGLISHWSGNGKIAIQHFQEAENMLPDRYNLAQGMLHLHIALARSVTGEGDEAISELEKLIKEEQDNPIYLTRLIAGLFYTNQFSGKLGEARKAAKQAQKIGEKAHLTYSYAMAVCMEATSCFCRYELTRALQLFSIAKQYRHILHKRTAIDAMAGDAITKQLLHQTAEAEKSLEELDDFIDEINDSNYLSIGVSCRARISLLRGNKQSTMVFENTFDEKPSFAGLFIWLEISSMTHARILIATAKPQGLAEAARILAELQKVSNKLNLKNQVVEIKVLETLLLLKQKKHEKAIASLEIAISLAQPGGWIRPFIEAGPDFLPLLNELKTKNTHPAYIDSVIAAMEESKERSYKAHHDIMKSKVSEEKHYEESKVENLTQREKDIVSLLARGMRNKEIANMLFISEGTVKKHVYNACLKLNVNGRISLVNKANKFGYVSG